MTRPIEPRSGSTLRRIVVGSREDAAAFACAKPYAMICFVSTWYGAKTPPRILRPASFRGRIVIRADDALPETARAWDSVPLSEEQAERIVRFVARLAPKIDTLFVHCRQGLGRSPGAAVALAAAYGLAWEHGESPPPRDISPNPHVRDLVARALEKEMRK